MSNQFNAERAFSKKVHELKTWPQFFQAILDESKPFEARKDDRGFEVGDDLRLREWSPDSKEYTGRTIVTGITYILRGTEHVAPGYCILGLSGGSNSQESLKARLQRAQTTIDEFQSTVAALIIECEELKANTRTAPPEALVQQLVVALEFNRDAHKTMGYSDWLSKFFAMRDSALADYRKWKEQHT